ncbi:hypothetical protein ABE85_11330 [Mitsuaria sp. 7]|nr:hypothetical protein ABE85_11330 [Mitsuaria sp. 7]
MSTIHAPDGSALARELHLRPGVGVAAHVLQGRGLRILRMRVDLPALILVDRGIKTVKPARGTSVRAQPRQALVLSGNQTVDFTNLVNEGAQYEARWLLFDTELLEDAHYAARIAQLDRTGSQVPPVRQLSKVSPGLADAFERARQALAPDPALPDAVARQRVLEVMHWLLEDGLALRCAPVDASVSISVRALIAGRLDQDWAAARVADALAMSEATLRRRLAAEGASMTALIVDARMATALTLLQATTQPVSEIARAVGYDSPSRFAVRFRERFGFAPTSVRGHERAD